jgi:hypothetical protein
VIHAGIAGPSVAQRMEAHGGETPDSGRVLDAWRDNLAQRSKDAQTPAFSAYWRAEVVNGL